MTVQPEEALRTRVLAGVAVAALIADRFYPQKAPQDAPRPYCVYQRISGVPERHMGGAAPLATAHILVSCYAASYGEAKAIADAIRDRMDGYRGEIAVGSATFSARSFALENDADDFVDPQAGSDDGVQRVWQDWRIIYVLPAPTLS